MERPHVGTCQQCGAKDTWVQKAFVQERPVDLGECCWLRVGTDPFAEPFWTGMYGKYPLHREGLLDLRQYIQPIPDFPVRKEKPEERVIFLDITPLLGYAAAYRQAIEQMAAGFPRKPDAVVAIDARGFWFGPTLAYHWGIPWMPARKPGKLPGETIREHATLEYGETDMEMKLQALLQFTAFNYTPGVLIVDDVVATGGTVLSVARLVRRLRGEVLGVAGLIDIPALGGSTLHMTQGLTVHTLLEY
jgi:adenine phosphoribosyltransferase